MTARFKKYINTLEKTGIDNILITDLANIYYLTGFTGSSAYLFIRGTDITFITDSRYKEQSETELSSEITITITTDYLKSVKQLTLELGSFYIESSSPVSVMQTLQKQFSGEIKIEDSRLLLKQRSRKDSKEIEHIKQMYRVASEAFIDMLKTIKYGEKEIEWAATLEYNMRRGGSKKTSFDTIVASGKRSSLVHGAASNKIIDRGEPITIDYGAHNLYCSDITRQIYEGDNKEYFQIVKIIEEAISKVVDMARAGVSCSELDKVARKHINSKGYSKYFTHGLGHGVGINVHEMPRFSPLSEDTLEEGNVITVEPGIYIPGKFGARLEDTILINHNGCEVLTPMDKYIYTINQ